MRGPKCRPVVTKMADLKFSPVEFDLPPIPIVIAGAGASRRYGSPKLLAEMPDKGVSLIFHLVSTAVAAGASPAVVVIGPETEEHFRIIAEEVDRAGGVPLHVEPAPAEMIDSLKVGLNQLKSEYQSSPKISPEYVLLSPADIPAVSRDFLRQLTDKCRQGSADLIRGLTPEGRGIHPVAVRWSVISHILQMECSEGMKPLWKDDRLNRYEWIYDCTQIFHDLDNPQDWQKFRRLP